MLAEDKAKYYRDELKPVFLETLVEKINFALPTSVIEQEINYALNNKTVERFHKSIRKKIPVRFLS